MSTAHAAQFFGMADRMEEIPPREDRSHQGEEQEERRERESKMSVITRKLFFSSISLILLLSLHN